MKHTPGPWKIRRLDSAMPTHIVGEHNQVITHWDDVLLANVETYEANARLISAAPEMLEALKAISDAPIWANPALAKIHNAVKAALAKADA